MSRVLVVDDEASIRRALKALLGSLGHEVTTAEDGVDAAGKLGATPFDLVLTDLRMPRADGFAVIRSVHEIQPKTPVVVLTASGALSDCVMSMRAGAHDFLTKPFHDGELERVVEDAIASRAQTTPKRTPSTAQVELVGSSPRLRAVLEIIDRVGPSDATVLVTGESGTGKEVVARLLHLASPRSAGPFVPVNCGAIPEGLVESELFGHVKGAFTGATDKRVGKFARRPSRGRCSSTRSASSRWRCR
jgi:DNA-binding NtrC family response regulator